MPHGHLVGQLRVALAEREVVYGIQYVGLSHTVVTDEAVDIGRKSKACLCNVFIIQYGELFKIHKEKGNEGSNTITMNVLQK